ncbi:MAG: hypothetical protein CUN53_02630 [Phototrophicales bacterium]|nr:MAG: hypothetical protein CUN53_02630 [Phototrophicales bacterium]
MAVQSDLNPVELPPEAPPETALAVADDDAEPQDDPNFSPSGTFIFAMALIIAYAIYLFSLWYEVTVVRGGA